MTASTSKGEAGVDPRKPFYIALSLFQIDGLLHARGEEFEGVALTPAPLVDEACEAAEEHGTETYIFQCIPIKRVRRGNVIVTDIPKPRR